MDCRESNLHDRSVLNAERAHPHRGRHVHVRWPFMIMIDTTHDNAAAAAAAAESCLTTASK